MHNQPNNPEGSALTLSPEDVERLLNDNTAEIRLSMADKIATAYGGATFGAGESQIAEQIFRLMLRDTEVKVRAAMAQQLKESQSIPRDIVMTMAHDVEEVALPVLQFSEVLTDKELLQLIAEFKDPAKHVAISRRHKVSGDVSGALVETGNPDVVGELVKNNGADLSNATLERIIAEHSDKQGVMDVLASRHALPTGVAEKLVAHVSGALGDALKKKYNIVSKEITKQVEKTRETATTGIIRYSMTDEELETIARSLMAYKRLTPSIILNALCQGHWRFFNLALAKMAGIPVENAAKLLRDKSGMGFKALYKKSGLPDSMYGPVRLLYHTVYDLFNQGVTPMQPEFPNSVVSRLLQEAEGEDIENMSYIIALVRKGPNAK